MSISNPTLTSITPTTGSFITNNATSLKLSGSITADASGGQLGIWLSSANLSKSVLIGSVAVGKNATGWSLTNDNIKSILKSAGQILVDGSYTISFTNGITTTSPAIGSSQSITLDAIPPAVTSITDNITGSVATGPITFTVNFNEAVTGVSTKSFTASNGAISSVTAGNNPDSYLVTVTPTANLPSGNVALSLKAGGAIDAAGNKSAAVNLSSLLSQPVHTLLPAVTSITATGTGISSGKGDLSAGHVVTLTVTLNEKVQVSGSPILTLNDGGVASYVKGYGTNTLVFSYPVAAGQNTTNLAVTGISGGTITDSFGISVNITGKTSGVLQIDTTTPIAESEISSGTGITNGNGALNAGQVVTMTVTMNEAVTISKGIPTLTLNDGGLATYVSGSGTSALVFDYTVGNGQFTPNLQISSLNTNGASIADGAGNSISISGLISSIGTLQIGPQPVLNAVSYNASTGQLTLTGANLETSPGEYVLSDFTLTGQHGVSYQLTGGTVNASSSSSEVVINVNATDQLALSGLLNQNGTQAADWTTYNLSASSGWDNGNSAVSTIGVNVSNVAAPTINSVSFNVATSVLTVTGSNFADLGNNSGIVLNDLTLSVGNFSAGNFNDNIGSVGGTIINQTSNGFSVQLNSSYDDLFSANGTSNNGNSYSLSASSGWDSGIGAAISNQAINVTGNEITIGGIINNSAMPDNSTLVPFRAATINDLNTADADGATISFTTANGILSGTGLSAGVTINGIVTYTLPATPPADLQSELQNLIFTPTAHQLATGQNITTDFTLTVAGNPTAIIRTLSSGIFGPVALATDSNGDVFVANYYNNNNTVEEFSASGSLVRTLSSGIFGPVALATDSIGDVFVANSSSNTVEEFSASGNLIRTLSNGISNPQALATDSNGDVFVANNTVEEFSASGNLIRTLSGGISGPGALATDSTGDVYVANYYNNTVEEFSASGNLIRTLSSGISYPFALATDSNGDVFVANFLNNTVEEFNASGSLIRTLSSGIFGPRALATDSIGDVFVENLGNNTVEEFSASGNLIWTLSKGISYSTTLATDSNGDVFVANDGNNTVEELSPTWTPTTISTISTNSNTQIIVTSTPNSLTATTNASLTNPTIDSTPHTGDLITIPDTTSFDSTAITTANVSAAGGSVTTLAGWVAGAFSTLGAGIAPHEIAWFQFSGNTYLVEQAHAQGTAFAFGIGDTLIELVGTLNESSASLNGHVLTI